LAIHHTLYFIDPSTGGPPGRNSHYFRRNLMNTLRTPTHLMMNRFSRLSLAAILLITCEPTAHRSVLTDSSS
jgi:hypothetical protein